MSKLVVVESPAKAQTIEKYLPDDFVVRASFGHIRDLPDNKSQLPEQYRDRSWANLGVDIEDRFQPVYVVQSARSGEAIQDLRDALQGADELYLATDEDREGEAISWHLTEVLEPTVPAHRMVFHEITQTAIREARQNTRDLDMSLVEAQEARRILDRLVGYPLSLLVSKKIRYGLSAGRVQSVAVRLLVEQERERRRFEAGQYWDLEANLAKQADAEGADDEETGGRFEATLVSVDGTRLARGKDFDKYTGDIEEGRDVLLLDESDAERLQRAVLDKPFEVRSIESRNYTTSPKPPFITSTLQQEASRKLNLSASRTMQMAQDLYENGLITYMRTDSVNLSDQAISASRSAAEQLYGPEYVHDQSRHYQSSSSSAQEAHEAIRPTGDQFKNPENVSLSGKKWQLYDLIWKRTVASQMADARKTSIRAELEVEADGHELIFRGNGNRIDFAGFISAYVQGADEPEEVLRDRGSSLPPLEEGEVLECRGTEPKGHETQPPRRYTEASLVEQLEDEGVGRPSTYATIMDKITRDERYARKRGKSLVPTYTGFAVTELLEGHFPGLVDVNFTARMEDELDAIARGEASKVDYLHEFCREEGSFRDQLDEAEETIDPDEARVVELEDFPATLRVGRYGPYVQIETDGDVETVDVPEAIAPADLEFEEIQKRLEKKQEGPVELGIDDESGESIYLKNGPYGPYVQRGEDTDDGPKPERESLPDELDPEDVTFDRAKALLSLPRYVTEHPDDGQPIEAGVGRYGPYVRHQKKDEKPNYENLDSLREVFTITAEEAIEKLKSDKSNRNLIKDLGEDPDSGESIRVLDGRYGPYVKLGDTNASVPDDVDPEEVTLDEALEWIEEKQARA
jgi:DNA topoisomerase-1